MKCKSPKILNYYPNGFKAESYQFFVPCGKCYACQNAKRGEWSIRCEEEQNDSENKSSFFITLTYDNDHLPVYYCDEDETKLLIATEMVKHRNARRWDFAHLDKTHLSEFIAKLQRFVKKFIVDNNLQVERNLVRFVATGEYGDVSHRPHYHCLMWFPFWCNKFTVQNLLKKFWIYGKSHVGTVSPSSINYVGKHQVKSCEGSEFQKKVAPIFQTSSRYKGGIGRTLYQRDDIKNLFFSDSDEKYLEHIQGVKVFKVAIPRFVKKKLHPDKLNEFELRNLEIDSEISFNTFMMEKHLIYDDFSDTSNDENFTWRSDFYNIVARGKDEDFRQRQQYDKQRVLKKISSYRQSNCSYEHI